MGELDYAEIFKSHAKPISYAYYLHDLMDSGIGLKELIGISTPTNLDYSELIKPDLLKF